RVLADIENPPYGEHASNLGAPLSLHIAKKHGCKAYFVDPVSVDELTDKARVSGFKGMERESFFHALNQKAIARKAAEVLGKPYEELNLIVCHMGGGVSVAAHQQGLVVDNYNVKDEGAFGMDRGGSLPVNAVINLCFSGKTKQEVKKMLGSEAGIFSYLGTRDFREVEARAFERNEPEAKLIFDAFAYQLCKDAGAMSAVLGFKVDAFVLTGGMAYSDRLCAAIESYLGKLAPVLRLPGEEEMKALALGALRVLQGEPAKQY
ncbi:MAG: butyrate kinase, partial [Clostridia bacterium]|nr:butyrate kinase [Clostridia bacterium]